VLVARLVSIRNPVFPGLLHGWVVTSLPLVEVLPLQLPALVVMVPPVVEVVEILRRVARE